MNSLNQCKTCALHQKNNTCPIVQGTMTDTDFCSKHTDTIYYCDNCGVGLLTPIFELTDHKIYCERCLMQMH